MKIASIILFVLAAALCLTPSIAGLPGGLESAACYMGGAAFAAIGSLLMSIANKRD